MTYHEEEGFDAGLAAELSIIAHANCVDCPHDIGIILALQVKNFYKDEGFTND